MSALINDLRKLPVLRALIPFVAGILLAKQVEITFFYTPLRILSLDIILLILLVIIELPLLRGHRPGMFVLSPAVILLYLSSAFILEESREMKLAAREEIVNGDQIIHAEIISGLEKKNSTVAFDISCIHSISHDGIKTLSENIRVYVDKKIDLSAFLPGDHLLIDGIFQEIINFGDSDKFDYRAYMNRRGFFYTVYINDPESLLRLPDVPVKLNYLALRLREKIISGWDTSSRHIAILCALTLGNKKLLDQDTRADFSSAGAMHLLAVSGLHVGMIWWILNLVIVVPKRKNWQLLKLGILVSILWFYAGVTGFSESVTRSVTMFTILSLSNALNRRSIVLNSLFLSAFILLVLDPDRLFEAGFQLSYLAVFGIIVFQPLISAWYANYHPIVRRLLDLLTVSISAQIFTLPLSIHLFHQFPVYFLLTNLIAIPLVSLILVTFIISLPLLIMNFSKEFTLRVLEGMVSILDMSISKISSFPGSTINDISLEQPGMLILFLSLIFLMGFLYYKRTAFLSLCFVCTGIFFIMPHDLP